MVRLIILVLFLLSFLQGNDSLNVRTFSRWPYSCFRSPIQLRDTIAILGAVGGLWFINISDLRNPVKVGEYVTEGFISRMVLKESLLYVADAHNGLRIFDVRSLGEIQEIGRLSGPGGKFSGYRRVFIQETLAFIVSTSGSPDTLLIIDISDPRNLIRIGNFVLGGRCEEIFVSDNRAYIATGSRGLKIIDVSNPSSPYLIGEWRPRRSFVTSVMVKDSFAYVGNYDTLQIINISNPGSLRELGKLSLRMDRYYEAEITDIVISETLLFVGVAAVRSPQVINIANPLSPYRIYYPPPDESPNAHYLQLRGQILFMGSSVYGFSIYDFTNPSSPVFLSYLPMPAYLVKVAVKDSLVVLGTGGTGLFILDIANPLCPKERGKYMFTSRPFFYRYIPGIIVRDTFIFAGRLGGNLLYVLNFSNPDSIFLVATCSVGLSAPYSVEIRSLFLKDSLIYAGLGQTLGGQGLVICNVKDPTQPQILGRVAMSNVDMYGVYVVGNYCYAAGGAGGFSSLMFLTQEIPI